MDGLQLRMHLRFLPNWSLLGQLRLPWLTQTPFVMYDTKPMSLSIYLSISLSLNLHLSFASVHGLGLLVGPFC